MLHVIQYSKNMPKAYSEDLRNRVLWSKLFLFKTEEEIARQFFVSPRTVQRICRTYAARGTVAALKAGRSKGNTTLHLHEEYILMRSILEKPDLRLYELANIITEQTGSVFSTSTLWRELCRCGLSNKKVYINAIILLLFKCSVVQ